jgi:hypothetical protein
MRGTFTPLQSPPLHISIFDFCLRLLYPWQHFINAGVRIVVTGDQGNGKSSLIVTFTAGKPVIDVPPVLDPTRLPKYLRPDGVPITIIDTSSWYQNICNFVLIGKCLH